MDSDVIIVGAGVIGCAIAYNLGKAGVKTLVIDKADGVGREASWAGAGVLTSHASTRATVSRTVSGKPCSLSIVGGRTEDTHAD